MPWQEQGLMDIRREFVVIAAQEDVNMRQLCQQYRITTKTGYKWLNRYRAGEGLADRSRKPHTSPRRTAPEVEEQVVQQRLAHPTWGGRKLRHLLARTGAPVLPAPSTITDILHRHDLVEPQVRYSRDCQRFEHEQPNDLWQLDFKGPVPVGAARSHPLTLLDDHSRFVLGLWACAHQRGDLVQEHLITVFRYWGMPLALLTDNGPPWGAMGQGGITRFEAWLLQLGVAVWHGRPYHPQTQGKVERFHETLTGDLLRFQQFASAGDLQRGLDRYQQEYNYDRPHQALDYAVPSSRYRPSLVPYPEVLPPIIYGPDDAVRKVLGQGSISFHGRNHFISRGLIGQPVAVRPTTTDGVFTVVSCAQQIATLDLRHTEKV